MNLLVTGANGFVGGRLCELAARKGWCVRRAVRRHSAGNDVVQGILRPHADWSKALQGIGTVVHLAARTHVIKETAKDPLAEFRRVNVQGTSRLAEQAAVSGVKRFVFISSIGVNGIRSDRPFTEKDTPDPFEPYAISKCEAEDELRSLAEETGLEVVVIRPPLVYGPCAPGNFGRLVRVVASGFPLPLGAVRNKRSMVALDNLVDLIMACVEHPAAAGKTFLVSDGEDISTPELIRKIAAAMNRQPRLFPVPPRILKLGGVVTGRSHELERLTETLQADITYTRQALEWEPTISIDEAIRVAVMGTSFSRNNRMKRR